MRSDNFSLALFFIIFLLYFVFLLWILFFALGPWDNGVFWALFVVRFKFLLTCLHPPKPPSSVILFNKFLINLFDYYTSSVHSFWEFFCFVFCFWKCTFLVYCLLYLYIWFCFVVIVEFISNKSNNSNNIWLTLNSIIEV